MWISLFLSVRKWLSIWLCCIDDRLIRKSDCLSGSICCCSFADALGFTLNLTSYNNFAQWRYSNQWSNREVLLLLVENYTQYPAPTRWNTLVCGNFWLALRGYYLIKLLKWTVLQSNPETQCTSWQIPFAPPHRFSAFWLRSKCSICSYQLNICSDTGHVSPSILNRFLQGDEVQELAPASSRVGLALQYRRIGSLPTSKRSVERWKVDKNVSTIRNIT